MFVFLLYAVFSITEYVVHKYLMHSPKHKHNILSLNHWTHHEHTLNNMNLKNSETYNAISNKYLGLYFTWSYSLMVLFVGLVECYLLYLFLKCVKIDINETFCVLCVTLFSIYQTSFWNTIHPDIHNVKEGITIYEGIPGWNGWKILFSSIYLDENMDLYKWFKINHTLHHLIKGSDKGNYNVTLPGADWLFGKLNKEKIEII
jgi:hypothetical protein